MERSEGRAVDQLRSIKIERHFTQMASGSVRITAGQTMVLCTASFVEQVPQWMQQTTRGWLTAEYRMLPGSTVPRTARGDRPDGRATEIQRLIGRSLRAVVDLEKIGPRTLYIDCDVLQADGGTRTLSITGAYIAMMDAFVSIRDKLPQPEIHPVHDSVAAVSVGIVDGTPMLDLCYTEDFAAAVDMNIVMTGSGKFIEVQGTGEGAVFSREELMQLLALGEQGIKTLTEIQKNVLN